MIIKSKLYLGVLIASVKTKNAEFLLNFFLFFFKEIIHL